MANGNTVIPASLRADIMRKHMENKNTLTTKGSIYVGTGEQYTDFGTDDIHCYKTAELTPPDIAGQALVSKGKSGATQQGIEWGAVKSIGIESGAVVGANGTAAGHIGNSKIFRQSIGTDDIGNQVVTNNKLQYDMVQIGDQFFRLTYHYPGAISESPTTITGMSSITSNEFIGLTSISAPIITASNYFNASSDIRLKTDIHDFKSENSILDIPVKEYKYKDTGAHSIGFIAQDLQKLFPDLVIENPDGYLGIQETKLVYLLLLEVKKLSQQIIDLQNKVQK